MTVLERDFFITYNDFVKAGEVSLQIQGVLKSIGFPPDIIRRAAICAYEAEMNVVMHGGDGQVGLEVTEEHIVLDFLDDGPGIPDLDLAFQKGFSTATPEHREMGFGAGMGLPNIKDNADELEIEAEKDRGTHLRIYFNVD